MHPNGTLPLPLTLGLFIALKCNRVKICFLPQNEEYQGEFRISQVWVQNDKCGVPTYYLAKLLLKTAWIWNKLDRGTAILINGLMFVVRFLHFMAWTCSDEKMSRIKCKIHATISKMHQASYNQGCPLKYNLRYEQQLTIMRHSSVTSHNTVTKIPVWILRILHCRNAWIQDSLVRVELNW